MKMKDYQVSRSTSKNKQGVSMFKCENEGNGKHGRNAKRWEIMRFWWTSNCHQCFEGIIELGRKEGN